MASPEEIKIKKLEHKVKRLKETLADAQEALEAFQYFEQNQALKTKINRCLHL